MLAAIVLISSAADILVLVTLTLRVHDLSGSGGAVAALVACTLVPAVVLAPVTGLLADRLPAVSVLAVASLAQAGVVLALIWSDHLAAVLVLSALLAVGNTVAQPAEFTLVPAVAGSSGLAKATGLVEAARYAGFAVGPVLAAILAAVGPRAGLLAAAAGLVVIAVALAGIDIRPARRSSAPSAGREHALDGLRVIRSDPVLRVTVGAAVGALLLLSTTLTAEVFWVRDVVAAGDTGYAAVVSAWMVGMVLGATTLARRVPGRLLASGALLAIAAQGTGIALQTAWAVLPVAMLGFAIGGLAHGVKNVLLRVLLTVRVPDGVRGRAFAFYAAARNGAELGAVAAGGGLVEAFGPGRALQIAGLGAVTAAAAGSLALRRGRRALQRQPPVGAPGGSVPPGADPRTPNAGREPAFAAGGARPTASAGPPRSSRPGTGPR